jgi:hypothetical protein
MEDGFPTVNIHYTQDKLEFTLITKPYWSNNKFPPKENNSENKYFGNTPID